MASDFINVEYFSLIEVNLEGSWELGDRSWELEDRRWKLGVRRWLMELITQIILVAL